MEYEKIDLAYKRSIIRPPSTRIIFGEKAMLNRCQFIGNLTKNPEVSQVNGTTLAKFTLACNRKYKDSHGNKKSEVEYVNFESWGGKAEVVANYLGKGSKVYVEGRFKTTKWEKNGETKYFTKIILENIQMLGGDRKQQTYNEFGDSSWQPPADYAAPPVFDQPLF